MLLIFLFILSYLSDKARKRVANKTKYIKDDHNLNNLNKILKEIEPLKEAGKYNKNHKNKYKRNS